MNNQSICVDSCGLTLDAERVLRTTAGGPAGLIGAMQGCEGYSIHYR
jgi:hypothetical protein